MSIKIIKKYPTIDWNSIIKKFIKNVIIDTINFNFCEKSVAIKLIIHTKINGLRHIKIVVNMPIHGYPNLLLVIIIWNNVNINICIIAFINVVIIANNRKKWLFFKISI